MGIEELLKKINFQNIKKAAKNTLLTATAIALLAGCGDSGGSSGGSSGGGGGDDDNDDDNDGSVTVTWVQAPQDTYETGMYVSIRAVRTKAPEFETNVNPIGNKTYLWFRPTSGGSWDNETPNPGDFYWLYLKAGFNSWDKTIECEDNIGALHMKPAGEYEVRASVERYDNNKTYSPTRTIKVFYKNTNGVDALDALITANLAADPKYGGHAKNVIVGVIPADISIVWDGETKVIEYIGEADTEGDKQAQFAGNGVKCSEFRKSHSNASLLTKLLDAVDDNLDGADNDVDGQGVDGLYTSE